MIKLTYKEQNRNKTTEKQALPFSCNQKPKRWSKTVLKRQPGFARRRGIGPERRERNLHPTRSSSWASTCIWIATWWCAKSMAVAPQPPQRSARANFWSGPRNRRRWPAGLQLFYEAGPFGYRLHRKLKELGALLTT